MRILILTPRVPWPPLDGGRIAMARLATSLGKFAEVELLSLNPKKHRVDDANAIDIDTARLRFVPGTPMLVSRFVSQRFRSAIAEAMRRFQPDVVQLESPFLLPYLPDVRSARIVSLRSLNVEFRIWEGLARNEKNPLRRLLLRHVASSLRKYEIGHLNSVDALVPISRDDADDFRALGCTKPTHVAPCGVEVHASAPPQPNTVGFIGSLDFLPNQEAAQWILDELWPRVIAQMPDARLSIAGSNAPAWLAPRVLGRVADAQAFMSSMSVMIAPLFAGGGMRIKVLEAMALGKPVVATSLGKGGVDVDQLLVAEDADTFADAVVRLLRDPAFAQRLGEAARAEVAAKYDSDRIGNDVVRFYEELPTLEKH
ncbi:MAG: glycosyltransferase [Acidobacteria bacterium]|nr:glycosyltransferase [Acidobacteriota bacterium]